MIKNWRGPSQKRPETQSSLEGTNNRFFIKILVACILSFCSSVVFAGKYDASAVSAPPSAMMDFKAVRDVYEVNVYDNVSDGCWKNPTTARDAVALELKRSGILATDEHKEISGFPSQMNISALGYETNGICVVYLELRISSVELDFIGVMADGEKHKLEGLNIHTVKFGVQLLSGPKQSMSERVNDEFMAMTKKFLLDDGSEYAEKIFDGIGSYVDDETKEFWREQINHWGYKH